MACILNSWFPFKVIDLVFNIWSKIIFRCVFFGPIDFLTSSLKPLNEFNKTWQEARSQRPLPGLFFSGRSENTDGHPGLWLTDTFSTFSLKPLNRIQRNLTVSKISTFAHRSFLVLSFTICDPLGPLFKCPPKHRYGTTFFMVLLIDRTFYRA